ncbi:hypothetical protein [Mucilaginibacter gossypiicola]|uniref:hypothetical protein n=1 Tax=Mucilaginibacter gossypiicola TaxID=551995 RepID=UPI000B80D05B|nr:hypothetical protein [Mucilaginibacter gossypiicola]
MKNINYKRLLSAFLTLVFITFLSFFITFADEETGFSNGFFAEKIVPVFKYLFIAIAFPCEIISHFSSSLGIWQYNIGIVLGCLLYSVLIEGVCEIYLGLKRVEDRKSL